MAWYLVPCRKALPLLHRSYWLMGQTKYLPPTSVSLFQRVFAGCRQSLLVDAPSRRYLHNLCIGAWTPTPRCSSGALARFFPEDNGLTSKGTRSAHRKYPDNATSTGNAISGLQSFLYVQAPILARPPGCTHRITFVMGSRAFYTTQ